jgi:hypothetical protein
MSKQLPPVTWGSGASATRRVAYSWISNGCLHMCFHVVLLMGFSWHISSVSFKDVFSRGIRIHVTSLSMSAGKSEIPNKIVDLLHISSS